MQITLQLFGRKVELQTKAAGGELVTTFPADFPMGHGTGWFNTIRESFAGAWQRNVTLYAEDALTHPTFWSCVTLIAGDIAKCGFLLVQEDADGIKTPVKNAAFSPVLRRPNHYQNRIQFDTSWMLSLLTRGNTYALKERDGRGVVTALYLLDPTRVKTLVSPSGDVYYSIGEDLLSGVGPGVIVPASEIIHDLINPIYHPLCGLSPVYASGHSTAQALKIMSNQTRIFENGSFLSGILLAPGHISEETAQKLSAHFNTNFMGPENAGKVAALGDGLKFESLKSMTAVDSQLIDQLKWTDEKICSTFHVPPYMVGVGPPPTYNNIEALNQQYYSQCLQILIASMELCREEGIGVLETGYGIDFNIEELLRMDSATKMKTVTDGIKGGVYTPNEGRLAFNKSPLKGGDTVYLQEQDHALAWLAERDAQGPPPVVQPQAALPPAPPTVKPEPVPAKDAAVLLKMMVARKSREAGIRAA